jgi:hypothetical protein
MKRRKVLVGLIVACLFIAVIAIQAAFGGGIGFGIDPDDIVVDSNTTITYTIAISSQDGDWFDVTIIPGTCSKDWFEWTKKEVHVAPHEEKQISLDVTPTDAGSFKFQVKAISRINPRTYAIAPALITSKPPPSPSPSPSPTPTAGPTCIGLMPDLPPPQKIMTKKGTKDITWTAFACDPDGDTIWYRFCVIGPGTGGEVCTDWSTSNEWTWSATISDEGYNTIYADVRDGKHNTDSTVPDYDDTCEYAGYEITANQPPCPEACLIPDQFSSQYVGATIKWTACALDPEGDHDTLWYRFLLKGPETGYVWATQRNWSTANAWTWTPTTPGYSEIEVWVRDNFVPPLSKDPDYADALATFKKYEIV